MQKLPAGRGFRRHEDAHVNQGDSDEMRRMQASKGRPHGLASLDANAEVPSDQMSPSRLGRLFLLMGA